jgi:hypothetical protein
MSASKGQNERAPEEAGRGVEGDHSLGFVRFQCHSRNVRSAEPAVVDTTWRSA